MIGRTIVLAVALCGVAPVLATSIEDCERVMAQFQGDVAKLAVKGDRPSKDRGDLRAQLRVASHAGQKSDFGELRKALDAFEKQASTLGENGRISSFDADRMVSSARIVGMCFERVEQGN